MSTQILIQMEYSAAVLTYINMTVYPHSFHIQSIGHFSQKVDTDADLQALGANLPFS